MSFSCQCLSKKSHKIHKSKIVEIFNSISIDSHLDFIFVLALFSLLCNMKIRVHFINRKIMLINKYW